ncbi:unnamed protein product [Withania somnifera]
MEKINEKGTVCVTGGTGYVTSWLIMRLLQYGYSVNTTINNDLDQGASFLEKLPNASKKLKIFRMSPDNPDSFQPAIEGCNGVVIGHSVDFEDKNDEEMKIQRAITAILGILKACFDSKTLNELYTLRGQDVVDESSWSDVDFIKKLNPLGAFYSISKTLIEKEVLNFGEKNGFDVVCLNHAWVHGPFVTPQCPEVVRFSMAMILGNWTSIEYDSGVIALVHTDDVARAHIFLLESPQVKGRYICSSADITPKDLSQFLRAKYPQYQIPTIDCLKVTKEFKFPRPSSKKLVESGFKFNYSLEDMYDGAIASCKQVGTL